MNFVSENEEKIKKGADYLIEEHGNFVFDFLMEQTTSKDSENP